MKLNFLSKENRRSLPPWSGLLALLVVLMAIMSVLEPGFISSSNINNIIRASAMPCVLGIGMTFAILTAGLDLSVGSVVAYSGVVLALTAQFMPSYYAVVATFLIVTITVGGINGSLIGQLNLNPFVVTLGALGIFRGVAYVATNGATQVVETGKLIKVLGDGNVGPIPGPLIVAVALWILAGYVLRYTYFGRDVYAVGGNEYAAQLAGINTRRVKIIVYIISGACAALGGIMQVGRLESAAPTAGAGLELAVVAGVLLGGTRLSGGVGTITGTIIGIFFLKVVSNALTILGVNSYWQDIVTGVLLVAAVLFDRIRLEISNRSAQRKES